MVSNSTVSARLEDEDLAEMIDAVVGDPRVVSVPEVLSSADDGTPIIDGTALEYCFNENNDPCFLDYVGQLASGKIRYIFFQDLEFAAEIRLQRWQVDNESPSAQHSVVTPFDANDVTALVVEQSQFANPSSGTPDPSNENTRLTTMGAIDSPLWHPFDLACVDLEFSNGEASVEVQTATGQYFKKSDGSYDSDSAISYLAEDVHVGGAEVYADFTITGMLSATSNLALCHNWAAFDGEE